MFRQFVTSTCSVCLAIGALATVLLMPQDARAQMKMSLNDCIEYAYANHPSVKLAQLNIADADWQIKENMSVGLPQFNAGADYQYYLQQPAIPAEAFGFPADPGTKLTFALKQNVIGSVGLNQLVFDNTFLKGLEAARQFRNYVDLQLQTVKRDLRDKVIDAYVPALLVTESISVLDQNITVQEQLLRETKAVFEAGFSEQLDVDRIEYSLTVLQTQRDNLARQYDIILDGLQFTINMPVDEEITLVDDIDALLELYGDVQLTDTLDRLQRPEYLTVLKARELSEIQVALYDKFWLPKVSVFAQYAPGFQGNSELFWIPSAFVGASLNFTIYDGGYSRAKRERAQVQVAQVDLQRQTLEQSFELEVSVARKQLESARARVVNEEKNLELAQRIYDTAQIKFQAGVGSSLELTQALSSLYRSNGSLIEARHELLSSRIALKRALGK